MTMLRQPEQRLISAYHDLVGTWPSLHAAPHHSWGGWPTKELPPVDEVARYAAGCATRMLVHGGYSCGGGLGPPSLQDVADAKRHLREGFIFVGLTEEWALSICLLNRMFEVRCHARQFSDTRPGHDKETEDLWYSTEPLKGFRDPYDGEVYE